LRRITIPAPCDAQPGPLAVARDDDGHLEALPPALAAGRHGCRRRKRTRSREDSSASSTPTDAFLAGAPRRSLAV